MKKLKLFVLLLLGTSLFIGCGKPTTPEQIELPNVSGGYKIVKKFQSPGYSQDVLKKDNLLYMAQGEGGLLIVDVTDPEEPQTLSVTTENVRGYSTKIAMIDSVVYLTAGSFGVSVVNVIDPVEPIPSVENFNVKPAKSLHIMDQYMFTAVSEQGVKVASLNSPNPIYPEVRGTIYTSGYAQGITSTTDSTLLFVACGEMGLSIYDISNFENGYGIYPRVGWSDTPGYAEDVIIRQSDSIAYLACGTAGLQILSYSRTTDTTLAVNIVGSYDGGGYAKELMYANEKIYMTAEMRGLQIIDVADVASPYLIGEVDTEFALGVDADEDYIYVADEDEGLIIISIPD
ncbi:MAG: hypothetical protein K8R86_03390 [Bacteroidales bacterium]|nr:hypothetical protein [Bacteroidales bacterium]